MNQNTPRAIDPLRVIAHCACAAALACAGTALATVPSAAARIDAIAGQVRVVRADGSTRAGAHDVAVFAGDTVVTGSGARVKLRFSDGGLMWLQPDTRLRVDRYFFTGASDGREHSFLSLLRGGLRAVTGIIGRDHKDSFRLSTPRAVIGVRGTEYAVQADGDRVAATVTRGEIRVCTREACEQVRRGEASFVTPEAAVPVRVRLPESAEVPAAGDGVADAPG